MKNTQNSWKNTQKTPKNHEKTVFSGDSGDNHSLIEQYSSHLFLVSLIIVQLYNIQTLKYHSKWCKNDAKMMKFA